jgi:hypothetical protein
MNHTWLALDKDTDTFLVDLLPDDDDMIINIPKPRPTLSLHFHKAKPGVIHISQHLALAFFSPRKNYRIINYRAS